MTSKPADGKLMGKDDTSNKYHENDGSEKREHWIGRADFVLSSAGYCIGLGNIWRFPYLCYKNGGGAFLIPYLIFIFIGAFPMFLLEYSMSQFSGRGPFDTYQMICPLMKGTGYGMMMVNIYSFYNYNAMLGYVLYYLYHSFSSILPWSTCDKHWNTEACYDTIKHYRNYSGYNNYNNLSVSSIDANISLPNTLISSEARLTPSEEFWRFNVLQITDGLEDSGQIRIPLFICLCTAWFLTFISVCWGIKVTGKIVYVTVLLPYIILIIFLIKGAMLPGAINGLKFYLIPKWKTLLSTKIWGEAAIQVFISFGMGYGGLLAYASYNKFHNNVYRDALIGPIISSGTSIFAGFVTFCILGHMAEQKGVTVDDVVTQGPGLVFEAYPAAIATFELSPVWSVLFFLLMLCVGVDTQFGMVETVTLCLRERFPKYLKDRKMLLTAAFSVSFSVLGIPLVMQGGIYVIQIIDWYRSLFTPVIVCILECIIIGWIYGLPQFNKDIEQMIGHKPSALWGICWKYITPLSSLLVLIVNMAQLQPVSYGDYQYPPWAIAIGWIIGLSSLVPIVVYFVFALVKENGTLVERMKKIVRPTHEWAPQLPVAPMKFADVGIGSSKENTKISESLL